MKLRYVILVGLAISWVLYHLALAALAAQITALK